MTGAAQLDTDILGGEAGEAGLHVSQGERRYCDHRVICAWLVLPHMLLTDAVPYDPTSLNCHY